MQAGRTEDGVVVPRGSVPSRAFDDAVRALTSIGYSEKEAHKSVERAAQKVDPSDLELLVRTALHD
jgi:Holliday junction resolvasome RuvABC DNA-binding subunit